MKDERRWLSYKPREKAGEELHHNLRLDSETAGYNRNQPDKIWLYRPDSAFPCGASAVSPPCSNPRIRLGSPPGRFLLKGL